ncbi:MAG: ATP-binding protein [Verrucomicrobiota bacterium]|nr:ATP-binding protein [Verrucomicrobiota bacterium]
MQIEHSEFQDQLVRGLVHRMNNILTLFNGYLGLVLQNKELDKPSRDALLRITEGACAAVDLMDRTHSLVRPSTVIWREVDLGELLRLLRPSFQNMCGPDTQMDLICPAELPCIWADRGRLRTAIMEVVRNACDATLGGGHVRIEVRPEAPGPLTPAPQLFKWILITVTDDGPGIPKDLQEKVFSPFFSTKKVQDAAGLGLSVTLGFVQQHGGVVRLESQPGKTVVQLRLPCRSEFA